MVHILTHNDLDGYAAGFIVSQHFIDFEQTITHLNYEKDFDVEVLQEGDIFTVTDYSIPPEDLFKALDRVGNSGRVIWCDHHKSAIEKWVNYILEHPEVEDKLLRIEGIRDITYCGTMLIWFYLECDEIKMLMNNKLLGALGNEQYWIEKAPRFIRLVDAWDCWKTNSQYRHDAELLNIAVKDELTIALMRNLSRSNELIQDYVKAGIYYQEFVGKWSRTFDSMYGFDKEFAGSLFNSPRETIRARVLNIGNSNSEYFGENINEYDVCITQCFNGTGWKISLYSNKEDIDCSYCAQRHDGGGHKGAAGCFMEQSFPPIAKGEYTMGKNLSEGED